MRAKVKPSKKNYPIRTLDYVLSHPGAYCPESDLLNRTVVSFKSPVHDESDGNAIIIMGDGRIFALVKESWNKERFVEAGIQSIEIDLED